MSLKAKEELQVKELTVIADKVYYSASEFAKCKEDNIITIVSKADHSHMAATKEYGKSQFQFDKKTEGYFCPQGHLLKPYKSRKKYSEDIEFIRYRNLQACSNCPVKEKCSVSEKDRTIQDRPYQRIADEVDKRTSEWGDMYKKRKQLVEHPFGTIKRSLGFSYFLTRGTENVKTESLMHFLVYNIKRTITIMGTENLIEALQV